MTDKAVYQGTGRRKTSVARVRLMPGTGQITVNGRDAAAYFGRTVLITLIETPFKVTETVGRFDVVAGKLLVDLEGRTMELGPRQGVVVPRATVMLPSKLLRRCETGTKSCHSA